MLPVVPEQKWTYVVYAAFFVIDLLMAARIFQRLIAHSAPVSPDGPIFFVLLLGLQVLLIWLLARLRAVIAHYQRLKHSYEQELALSQQVMDSAELGLTVLDEGGHFVYVNQAFAEMVGRPASALLGHTPLDFCAPLPDATFWQNTSQSHILSLSCASGQVLSVRTNSSPRWHDRRRVGYIVSFAPLTLTGATLAGSAQSASGSLMPVST